MEEINMIEDMAKEYFEANPNSNNYIINKAVLGTKLEIGTTKTEAVSKGLEIEYPFIKNGRGLITIDRKGFFEFEILSEEQSKHISTMVEIKMKYPQLAKSIVNYKEIIDKDSKILAEKEKENQELTNQANELEQKVNDLTNSTNETKSKLENLKPQYDKLKEENDLIIKEYNEKTEAEIQKIKEETQAKKEEAEAKLNKAKEENKKAIEEHNKKLKEEQKLIEANRKEVEIQESQRNWFVRRNVVDYELEKSPMDKFLGEFLRFFIYGFVFLVLIDFFI
jgi:DNA repair exonuclease SbcCD ATPase subunit